MKISCSILSCENRIESIEKLNKTDIDYLHIDVMDGKFVENTNFTIEEIKNVLKTTNKKIDIHLMVENPMEYIQELSNQNIEYITIHRELDTDIYPIIRKIKALNYKAGISIKPGTSVNSLIPYLNDIDLILVMSVEPGYGNQQFLPRTLPKLENLNRLLIKYPNIEIEVDGGITDKILPKLIKNRVSISVVGSFITKEENYQLVVNKLKGIKK